MSVSKKPLALIIMDGWGHRLDNKNNAIAAANTPNLDRLAAEYTSTLISGSGLDVGLPDGQMGNSEVGHVNLGAGRVVYQDFTKISKSIDDGDFFENAALCDAIDAAVSKEGAVHVMGLLSDGGVHSHQSHLFAAIKLASKRGAKRIYLHSFLDGRDTPPKSADVYLAGAKEVCDAIEGAQLATMIGRYFAMDRDNRWDRVEQAYNLLVDGKAEITTDDLAHEINNSYNNDVTDEFVKATKASGYQGIQDNDAVLFMNFRADRAREISHALTNPAFTGFERTRTTAINFVMLTEYESTLKVPCAYPTENLKNVLGEWLEQNNKTQLRISETEKSFLAVVVRMSIKGSKEH